MIRPWLSSLIHYLFIATCDFCSRELSGKDFNRVCLRCAARLENSCEKSLCQRCGHPLSSSVYHPVSGQENVCDECFSDGGDLQGNRSLFLNQGLAKQLVYDFKFEHHSSYAPIIVYWALKKTRSYLESFDIYVPIPLGKKGLYEREFCQVTKVTRGLSKALGKPMLKVISRNEKKYRQAQHHLSAQERKIAVGEKYLYASRYRNRLSGKRILVIDDIYTSGSTLKNAARLIRENNQNTQVSSFTFLRTVLEEKKSGSPNQQLSKV